MFLEMPTSQYQVAGDFHIFDPSLMISQQRIPPIVFNVETKHFLVKKALDCL